MRVAGAIAECIFDTHGSNSVMLGEAVLGHDSLCLAGPAVVTLSQYRDTVRLRPWHENCDEAAQH